MHLDYHHKSLKGSDNVFQFPKSEEEWRKIAKGFEEKWNFPHALGAVDGKHVRINPAGTGSFFFNYKGYHSIVLLRIVNANYEFILVDFGVNSCVSDGGVLEYTEFFRRLKGNMLNIPKQEQVMACRMFSLEMKHFHCVKIL
jgi:hypothetical protein